MVCPYELRGPINSQTDIGGELPFRLRPFNVPNVPYKLIATKPQVARLTYKNGYKDANSILNARIIYPLGSLNLARKDLHGLDQTDLNSMWQNVVTYVTTNPTNGGVGALIAGFVVAKILL